MDNKTHEELMEIKIKKSELSYETDGSQMTRNRPTFKKLLGCLQCGKSFTSTDKLKTHERIHSGKKPLSCSKFYKKFKHSSDLKTHERIHTDEKPFGCSECDKKFKR